MSSQSIFQNASTYIGFIASAIAIGAFVYAVFKLKDNETFRSYLSQAFGVLLVGLIGVATIASNLFVALSVPFSRNGIVHHIIRELWGAFFAIGGVVASVLFNVVGIIRRAGSNIKGFFAYFLEPDVGAVDIRASNPFVDPTHIISIPAGEDHHVLEEFQHVAAQLNPTTAEPGGTHIAAPADKDMKTGIEEIASSSGSTGPTAGPQHIIAQPHPVTIESGGTQIPIPAGAAVQAGVRGKTPSESDE